jgi:DNA-binding Lrp family transcriptional regulator
LDLVDRQILNVIQSRFPLAEEPYRAIGDEVGLTPDEVMERIRLLRRRHVVRQISAIFDTRRLGYKTTLVACSYPPDKLHRAALTINRHPGVSHNYAREGHPYNLWFTLAVGPRESLDEAVAEMARRTGATSYRLLPTLRFFKIGVNFDMVKDEGAAFTYNPDLKDWNKVEPLTDFEVRAVQELQEDLPLTPRPFDALAERLGITTHALFALAQDLQRRGAMRRYSAVLHHRRAGFRYNAMSVWRVPPERGEEVGAILASSPWISHCYERPTFPDWPYTHFGMVHATSREKCDQVIQELSQKTGVTDYLMLFSTREYKKTRVRYFV